MDPQHEGCAAHGSDTRKAAEGGRERLLGFQQAVQNALATRGLDKTSPVIIMCTSGSRAPYAARALHEAGFAEVYTQVEGFEGIKAQSGADKGKRVIAGWKREGLPWSYELLTAKMYFNFDPARHAALRPGDDGMAKGAP